MLRELLAALVRLRHELRRLLVLACYFLGRRRLLCLLECLLLSLLLILVIVLLLRQGLGLRSMQGDATCALRSLRIKCSVLGRILWVLCRWG